MSGCPTPIPMYGYTWNEMAPTSGEFDCHRYSCPKCGPERRQRIVRFLHLGARHGAATRKGFKLRLLTFTRPIDDGSQFGVRADHIRASKDLRRVIQKMRRGGTDLQYAKVIETTKRGRIHLHLLTHGDYVPKCTDSGRRARGLPTGRGSGSPCYCAPRRPCIQQAAHDHGFGWVDVRAVASPARAVGYIVKYVMKQSDVAQWPKSARRMSYSRDYAGGQTMGGMDAEWWDGILAQMSPEQLATREANRVVWLGVGYPRRPHECPRTLPRPGPGWIVHSETGELLPIPA